MKMQLDKFSTHKNSESLANDECAPVFLETLRRAEREAEEAQLVADACTDWRSRMQASRLAARKKIQPGFPRFVPFINIKEMREYFSQPLIVCLVCGKPYKLLANHLRDTHDIDPDHYRAGYNILWRTGLVSSDLAESKSIYLKERLAEPGFLEVWFANKEVNRSLAHQDARWQRSNRFRNELSIKHLELAGIVIGRWKDADFLKILDVMKLNDALLIDIAGKVIGLPPLGAARKWFYSTHERRALLSETVRSLSIANQARAGQFSQQTIVEVKRLRETGLLLREIAVELGLSVMTVAKLSKAP